MKGRLEIEIGKTRKVLDVDIKRLVLRPDLETPASPEDDLLECEITPIPVTREEARLLYSGARDGTARVFVDAGLGEVVLKVNSFTYDAVQGQAQLQVELDYWDWGNRTR